MCESSRVSERGGERPGRGVSARGTRRGRASGGFDPGAGRDASDVPRAGKGLPEWQGRDGRRAGLWASRAGRCELGRASGWAGRVGFASRGWGASGQGGVPVAAESRGPRRRVSERRQASEPPGACLPVCTTCVASERVPCLTWAGGTTPSPLIPETGVWPFSTGDSDFPGGIEGYNIVRNRRRSVFCLPVVRRPLVSNERGY